MSRLRRRPFYPGHSGRPARSAHLARCALFARAAQSCRVLSFASCCRASMSTLTLLMSFRPACSAQLAPPSLLRPSCSRVACGPLAVPRSLVPPCNCTASTAHSRPPPTETLALPHACCCCSSSVASLSQRCHASACAPSMSSCRAMLRARRELAADLPCIPLMARAREACRRRLGRWQLR